jgi:hypothetical protein
MLRDNKTGLYYRRTKGSYSPSVWVEQGKASIWVTKNGPAQAKSLLQNKYRRWKHSTKHDLEIVTFTLTEKPCNS